VNVLTICDRYNWGGASQVARSIHEMLLIHGHQSRYLYGYDKIGLPNKNFPKEVVTAGYWFGPHLNYSSYSLIGKNVVPVSDSKLDRLVKEADVIHLHNIHDYAFNYNQLVKKINQYNKPVVVTCHDSWYITGRCSLPSDCTNWRNGCINCDHKDYYHSSLIDRAQIERIKKLAAFNSVKRLVFVSPSKWLYEHMAEVYGKNRATIISNSVDTGIFGFDIEHPQVVTSRPVLLLIANDFKDHRKVNSHVVNFLIYKGIELHVVGSNSPFEGKNVTNHGRLVAAELAKVMNKCNVHLFLSRMDNQPLVVLESLCAGMVQLSFKDKAVTGLGIEDHCLFIEESDLGGLLQTLMKESFKEKISSITRKERAKKYQAAFSRETMYSHYTNLYYSLVAS
jgi:putative colanic acid biosynthesis glycosyltransferase